MPGPASASLDAAAGVLRRRHDAVLRAWLATMGLELGRPDDAVSADVGEALSRSLDVLAAALEDPAQDDRAALAPLRAYVRRTVLRGVGGPTLLRWLHHVERLVWDELEAAARDDAVLAAGLLGAMRRVMEFVEALDVVCGAAFEATAAALAESGDAVRARLVRALVRGEEPGPGVLAQAAEACGLVPGRPVVAAVVRPAAPFADDAQAAVALRAVAGVLGPDATATPAAVLDGDVVALLAGRAPADAAAGLARAAAALARHGIAARGGVSVAHDDLREAPDAYGEALLAAGLATADRPVVPLGDLALLDYLLLRAGGRTAWALVPPAVGDLVAGGDDERRALVQTLLALVRCDGNVRSAAQHLGVHANTVHARIAKVRELTGLDPRRLADLQELVLAARLAAAR